MVKWDVLGDIDKSIRGEKVINISAETQDKDLAQQIVAEQINQEREKRGIILSEGEKESLSRIISNYFGKRDLAEQIIKIQPLFYDNNKIWWSWNNQKYKWEIIDETDVLLFVKKLSRFNTIKSKEKTEILEALKQEARTRKPKEIKPTWIQFKDTIFDIKNGEKFKATPKYFATNPLPYKLHQDKLESTPIMDKIFKEWVGKDYVKTLYEILAFCMLPDYPINRLFCFIGVGMNGKSKYLELLEKFIGRDNVCTTDLDIF